MLVVVLVLVLDSSPGSSEKTKTEDEDDDEDDKTPLWHLPSNRGHTPVGLSKQTPSIYLNVDRA